MLLERAFCEFVSESRRCLIFMRPNCFYQSLLLLNDKDSAPMFSITTFCGSTLIISRKRSDSLECRAVRISVLSPSCDIPIDFASVITLGSTMFYSPLIGFCSVSRYLIRSVEASLSACSSRLLIRIRRVYGSSPSILSTNLFSPRSETCWG